MASSPPSDSDCVLHNFLMDPGAMYPEGFHPVRVSHKRDYSGVATYLPRSAVGVKYYFADFGISVYIDPTSNDPRLVTGVDGRDQDPPELSDTKPYDPFKLDIFIIGNMFKLEFCDVTNSPRCFAAIFTFPQRFSNTEFLRPLADSMTTPDPLSRPSAEDTLLEWHRLREGIYTVNKEWRPRPREEDLMWVAWDMVSLYEVSRQYGASILEGLSSLWSYNPL